MYHTRSYVCRYTGTQLEVKHAMVLFFFFQILFLLFVEEIIPRLVLTDFNNYCSVHIIIIAYVRENTPV
jgi:hypothetical protein